MECNSIKTNRYLFSSMSTHKGIDGNATTEGTQQFIASSDIALHHHFRRSNLYVNPIIHGPPRQLSETEEFDDQGATARGLLYNRSNGVFVYDYNNNKPWHTTSIYDILSSAEDFGVKRDQIVTMANLGVVESDEDIDKRLTDASKLSKINNIDMAIIEVSCMMIM